MARIMRLSTVAAVLVAALLTWGTTASEAGLTRIRVSALSCPDGAQPAVAASRSTQVAICPGLVEAGTPLRVLLKSYPNAGVRLTLSYPTGETASVGGMTDAAGQAVLGPITVKYNPLTQYAQLHFALVVTRGGSPVETLPGVVTVVQAPPLSDSRLRVRPEGQAAWCVAYGQACTVQNNSSVQIRVDSDANVQVAVSLVYPDGSSVACPSNDLTENSFTTDEGNGKGLYRCTLSVALPSRASRRGVNVNVVAQISVNGYTRSLQRRLWLSLA